jgi:hypothetical protein
MAARYNRPLQLLSLLPPTMVSLRPLLQPIRYIIMSPSAGAAAPLPPLRLLALLPPPAAAIAPFILAVQQARYASTQPLRRTEVRPLAPPLPLELLLLPLLPGRAPSRCHPLPSPQPLISTPQSTAFHARPSADRRDTHAQAQARTWREAMVAWSTVVRCLLASCCCCLWCPKDTRRPPKPKDTPASASRPPHAGAA